MRAPFPWFGGKSRAASLIWSYLGDVANYVEPFAGSLAVLLGRPHRAHTETVNDADCYVVNFWRAVSADPVAVAQWADWPVSEADQNARHVWLMGRAEFRERMNSDPGYYDAKIAGWWVWGQNIWIGTGWCDSRWYFDVEGDAGTGIHRQLPNLGNGGMGINRKLPHLGDAGTGIAEWLISLQKRLRRVRIACGDWSRVVTPSVTTKHGLTGILLDPPYATENEGSYAVNDQVAVQVAQWARENGDNPLLRIALCGYQGEHDLPGWEVAEWGQRKGYQKTANDGTHSGHLERIWFSPHCLKATRQVCMFEEALA